MAKKPPQQTNAYSKSRIETLEKMWIMLTKDSRIVNFEYYTPFSSVFIINFEQVIVCWDVMYLLFWYFHKNSHFK